MPLPAVVRGSWQRVKRWIMTSSFASQRLLRDATVVFLYHDVSDTPSPFNDRRDLNVPPAVFRRQLDLIREVFHVIDADRFLSGDYSTPAALVTFDDGNRSYAHEALPILKEQRIPSINFLNMGPIRGEVCWAGLVAFLCAQEPALLNVRNGEARRTLSQMTEADLEPYVKSVDRQEFFDRVRAFRGPVLSAQDLQALSHESLVRLGNHLFNHYNAARLSPERLVQEYRKNQHLLDAHPRGTRLLSYPFGHPGLCQTAETTRLLRREGASILFSAYPLPNVSRQRVVYHRVRMSASIRTTEDLFHATLCNYVSAWLGRGPVTLA